MNGWLHKAILRITREDESGQGKYEREIFEAMCAFSPSSRCTIRIVIRRLCRERKLLIQKNGRLIAPHE